MNISILFNVLGKIRRFTKDIVTSNRFKLLIFFVTNKCNARCKTCFYWRNLNQETNELDIKEIEAISSNLGEFDTLQITGGEPFLRDDLDKICEIFYKTNKVKAINIPTNCLMPERISRTTEKIIRSCPKADIAICCALDGIGKTHDEIRGVKGNFEKCKATVSLLKKLVKQYANFNAFVLTTLCADNYAEHGKIAEFVREELKIGHNFDFARQNTAEDDRLEKVPLDVVKKINKRRFTEIYLNTKHNVLRRIIRVGETKIFNKLLESARKKKKWPLRCIAGRAAAVLEPNGDVRLCEHRDIVGNVREAGYDIFRVLNSEKAVRMKKDIITSRCSCDHSVFIILSIASNRYYKITNIARGLESLLWSK